MSADPGWKLPRRALVAAIVAPRANPLRGRPLLVALRGLVLGFSAGSIVLLGLLWAFDPAGEGAWWGPLLVAGVGAGAVANVRGLLRRPLGGETEAAVAAAFRARFLACFRIASGVLGAGFLLALILGKLWVYLAGLPFALAMVAMAAPTRDSIEQLQRAIVASGRDVSLARAVMLPGPDVRLPGTPDA